MVMKASVVTSGVWLDVMMTWKGDRNNPAGVALIVPSRATSGVWLDVMMTWKGDRNNPAGVALTLVVRPLGSGWTSW